MTRNVLWHGLACLLAAMFVASSVQAAEGDRDAGRKKFYSCGGCHGIEGYSNTYPNFHVPRIGGQHADYILAALKAYKTGARNHVGMQGNAMAVPESDWQDIAAYVSSFYSSSVSLSVTGDVAAGKKKAKECAGCHGEDGNSAAGSGFPRLAGQYEDYLVRALKEYKSGARKNALMAGIAAGLSEADMESLSAFYASQRAGLIVVEK
jgi:cytochrome c553